MSASASLPVVKGTPLGAALLYPRWQAYQLQEKGVFMGYNLFTGESFYLDPMALRLRDASGRPGVGNSNLVVAGGQDSGKSTCLKCLSIYLGMLQAYDVVGGPPVPMRILAEDHRYEDGENEMRPLTDWFRGKTVSSNDVKGLNPFHPDLGLTHLQTLDLTVAIAESALRRGLTALEGQAAQVGVWRMWHNQDLLEMSPLQLKRIFSGLAKSDLIAYDESDTEQSLRFKEENMAGQPHVMEKLKERGLVDRPNNVSEEAFAAAASTLYTAFSQITGEKYGYLLGNDVSMLEVLAGRFVCINWSAFTVNALDLMQLLMWKNRNYTLVNNQTSRQPHLHLVDELHRIVNNPNTAQALQEAVNTSRQQSTINVFSTQYLSQVIYAGEADSFIRGAARNILKGIAGYFILKPSDNDRESLDNYLEIGFTSSEIDVIRELEQGQIAFKLPGRPAIFFKLEVMGSIYELIRTNKARDRMLGSRRPVTDFAPTAVNMSKNGHKDPSERGALHESL